MKPIHIHIKTIMADNIPTPPPSLLADLIDAVLKAPGLRVQSIEVVEANDVSMITRRVRHMVGERSDKSGADAPGTPPQMPEGLTEKEKLRWTPHVFQQSTEYVGGCVCGMLKNADIHIAPLVGATAKPGEGQAA